MTEQLKLVDDRISLPHQLDIKQLISSYQALDEYIIVPCRPATGLLYITKRNPSFISGHLRMRGRDNGKYPLQIHRND